jgi:hypothetical protein
MEHIYQLPNFGEDWFTYPNLYSRFIKEIPENGHFVEVGSWKGKSIAYLGVEAINSGKTIKIDAVDTWNGSLNEQCHVDDPYVRTDSLYTLFCANISRVSSVVNPIRLPSLDAAKKYADGSLDIVFIDACHAYECVREDIAAWYPKVKIGGTIAGHDYTFSFPGVVKAVNEFFGSEAVEKTEMCWVFKKTQ